MNLNWAIKTIKDAIARKFFGKLTISLEGGKVVNIKKEENLKPE